MTPGYYGNCLELDGTTNSWGYLGDNRSSCFWHPGLCSNGFTMIFWIHIYDQSESEVYFLSNGGQTGASYGISISYHGNNILKFCVKTNYRWWIANCPVSRNTWHQMGLTWDSASGSKFYMNGVKCGEDLNYMIMCFI